MNYNVKIQFDGEVWDQVMSEAQLTKIRESGPAQILSYEENTELSNKIGGHGRRRYTPERSNYVEVRIETLPNKTREVPIMVDGELVGWFRVGVDPVIFRSEAEVVQGETELDRFLEWAEANKDFSDSQAWNMTQAIDEFREANE